MPQFPQHNRPKVEDYPEELEDLVGTVSQLIEDVEKVFANGLEFEFQTSGFYYENDAIRDGDFPQTVKKPDRVKKKLKEGKIAQCYNTANPTEEVFPVLFWTETNAGVRINVSGLEADKKYFLRVRFE